MNFLTQGKTNWKFIAIVIVLAIIVAGGILGYIGQFRKEIISLTKFPEIKKPEKVAKDETANWKTYKDEEYGFEIKYPSTLDYKEKQGGLFGIEFPKLDLGLIIEGKPENFSDLESYLNTVAKEKNNDCKIEDDGFIRYCYSVENKDFGDNKTFAIVYRPLGGNSASMGCTGIDAYFENNNYFSIASYGYCAVDFDEGWAGPGAKVNLENYNIIQQMLSTFRFLE